MNRVTTKDYSIHPIGRVHSPLVQPAEAPKQGWEGAPDAWLEIDAAFARGLDAIREGQEIVVLTWLHRARRDVLAVTPGMTGAGR